ncbi:hypothetical protein QE385_003959 [Sphingomonas sp. SORGH_AS 950]|uniref:hypothetical protein n=1 Tax=Sphingomonas sp. SORGH_AS_0950 TaxID=3041792 RepID=UPI00278693AD|nr:hypothetical protein [Sphingomonas sp. SORGH_AS_0950]MDQ1159562.1 hypothetical protein [Sphingomonas sp. SORGH_AS_0950]
MTESIIPQSRDTDIPGNITTVHAMGHFAVLLLTVLNRQKAVNMREFADHLAVFAFVTDESDPPSGLILAYWAGLIKEAAAQDCDRPDSPSDAGRGSRTPTHGPDAGSSGTAGG